MKDAEDEYEKAENRLQDQLREMKEQLNMAQRVLTLVLDADKFCYFYLSVYFCAVPC